MVQEQAVLERYQARLKRYYTNLFWRFVRQHHADAETENGRLWLVVRADQFDDFCTTFGDDDIIDIINAQIIEHKLYIAARDLVPYATDYEILAGKERSVQDGLPVK